MLKSLSNLNLQFFDEIRTTLRWLITPHCLLCGQASRLLPLCAECQTLLPQLTGHLCKRCSTPIPVAGTCGACLHNPPAFNQVQAALSYHFPADHLVHLLKFQGQFGAAKALADALVANLDPLSKPHYLVPVPLHPKRLRERGFNQSLLIAKHLGQYFDIPILLKGIDRQKHTLPQTMLSEKVRKNNIKDAFAVNINLSGKTVAIVDDVMTTGATANQLAQTLKDKGASAVYVWVPIRA